MIQIIGIMIGGYIFTRMLEMMINKNVHLVARIFAGFTILLDLVCIFALLMSGLKPGPAMPY